jgi:hypothetical protein
MVVDDSCFLTVNSIYIGHGHGFMMHRCWKVGKNRILLWSDQNSQSKSERMNRAMGVTRDIRHTGVTRTVCILKYCI